jgi:hypothetical protein
MAYHKACGSIFPLVQSKALCHFKRPSIEIMLSTPEGFEILVVDARRHSHFWPSLSVHWKPISSLLTVI